jgi:Uma2 family endonuclease
VESGHSTTKLTYADYVRFPEDGLRHEIIDGEHYVTPSPSLRHQRISGTIYYLLRTYLEKHPIGELFYAPVDALLGTHDIVVPDLLYLSEERRLFLTAKNLQGPPSLVIEILSPSTSRRDRQLKRDLYERVGVEEYWLVDPEPDVVNIYRWGNDAHESSVEYAKNCHPDQSLVSGTGTATQSCLRLAGFWRNRRWIGNVDPLRAAPESFERIERSRFWTEDVHDEVEVVEKNPARLLAALYMRWFHTALGKRILNRIGDRVNLADVLAGGDHEVIRKPIRWPEVEHDDIGGLAILGGVDGPSNLCWKAT